MPHKCARCSKIYEDNAAELIAGCDCGSKVFLYLRADYAGNEEETIRVLEEKKLSESDLKWLDDEFRDHLRDGEKTVSLDIENVLRVGEGKFQLDLRSLMRGEPIVIKAAEGVYYIDIQYGMKPKKK